MPDDSLSMTVASASSVEALWTALTVGRSAWWPELTLAPTVGAAVRWIWEADGQEQSADGYVTEVVAPHLLVFRWRQPGWSSPLEVRFQIDRAELRSVVTLVERGFSHLPDGAELRAAHEDGWTYHLRNLLAAASRGGIGS